MSSSRLPIITSNLTAILLVAAILGILYVTWSVISPFSTPLISAIVLSMSIREPSDLVVDVADKAADGDSNNNNHNMTMMKKMIRKFRSGNELLGLLIADSKSKFNKKIDLYLKPLLSRTGTSLVKVFVTPFISIVLTFWFAMKRPDDKSTNNLLSEIKSSTSKYASSSSSLTENQKHQRQTSSSSYFHFSPPTSVLIKMLGVHRWPFVPFTRLPFLWLQTLLCVSVLVLGTARLLMFYFDDFGGAILVASGLHLVAALSIQICSVLFRIVVSTTSTLFFSSSSSSTIMRRKSSSNRQEDGKKTKSSSFETTTMVIINYAQQEANFIRATKAINTAVIAIGLSFVLIMTIYDEIEESRISILELTSADEQIKLLIPTAETLFGYTLSPTAVSEIKLVVKELKHGMNIRDRSASHLIKRLWIQIKDTDSFLWDYVLGFNTTKVKSVVQDAGYYKSSANVFLSACSTFVWSSVRWTSMKVAESVLFMTTLMMLMSMERTILYYILRKIFEYVLVFPATTKRTSTDDEKEGNHQDTIAKKRNEIDKTARDAEVDVVRELNGFFYAFLHKFVFHFFVTLCWYTLFQMPLSVTLCFAGAILVLFSLPFYLHPMFFQIIFGIAVIIVRYFMKMSSERENDDSNDNKMSSRQVVISESLVDSVLSSSSSIFFFFFASSDDNNRFFFEKRTLALLAELILFLITGIVVAVWTSTPFGSSSSSPISEGSLSKSTTKNHGNNSNDTSYPPPSSINSALMRVANKWKARWKKHQGKQQQQQQSSLSSIPRNSTGDVEQATTAKTKFNDDEFVRATAAAAAPASPTTQQLLTMSRTDTMTSLSSSNGSLPSLTLSSFSPAGRQRPSTFSSTTTTNSTSSRSNNVIHHVANNNIDDNNTFSEYMIATSIILGLFSQGVVGAVSGPAMTIIFQSIWESIG